MMWWEMFYPLPNQLNSCCPVSTWGENELYNSAIDSREYIFIYYYITLSLFLSLSLNTLCQREWQRAVLSMWADWATINLYWAGHNAGVMYNHFINIKILNWRDLQLWLRNKIPILGIRLLIWYAPQTQEKVITAEWRGITIILPKGYIPFMITLLPYLDLISYHWDAHIDRSLYLYVLLF